MRVESRIHLAKATLAVLALAALANRFWLHWCGLTLADGATGLLVAATLAVAGLRPGINALLCAVWTLWAALCLVLLFVLRPDHIGADAVAALSFCGVLASAAEYEQAEARPPASAPSWPSTGAVDA
jgi:hypothetical protein